MPSLRFADPETLTQYPLEISSTAAWQPAGDSPTADGWRFGIELGALPAGEMIAPSLSLLDAPGHRFTFCLEADGVPYVLAPIPPTKADEAVRKKNAEQKARVRTAIDCFHIEKKIRHATLRCELTTPVAPSRYLLTVSIRPTEIKVRPPEGLPTTLANKSLPSISQMLQNPRIGSRACSPVATAMVMSAHRKGVVTEQVIAECHDPVTGMYGLWPLAVSAAAKAGLIGAVELFDSWTPALECLAAGLPLVASIRYAAGELPGAAMNATGGHLVVVTGVDGDEVLINDPAASNHGTVSRRCPLDAFSRAWFRHRGAVYILCP